MMGTTSFVLYAHIQTVSILFSQYQKEAVIRTGVGVSPAGSEDPRSDVECPDRRLRGNSGCWIPHGCYRFTGARWDYQEGHN